MPHPDDGKAIGLRKELTRRADKDKLRRVGNADNSEALSPAVKRRLQRGSRAEVERFGEGFVNKNFLRDRGVGPAPAREDKVVDLRSTLGRQ